MHHETRNHHDHRPPAGLDDERARARLKRWLAAEAEAESGPEAMETADEALFALFEALPPVEPPPGFAERVLARAGVVAEAVATHPWAARLWRLAVSLAMVVTGCAVLVLPSALGQLTPSVGWSTPFRWVSETLVALGNALANVLSVWQDMAWLSGVLGRAAASPTGVLSLAVTLAVAGVAFRLLLELDARDRSWSHA